MNKKIVVIVVCNFLAGSALAGTMSSVTQFRDTLWVGSLSAGSVWEHGGNTQTFYLTPEIEKSYVGKRLTKTLLDGEIFLGIQKTLTQAVQSQLGLAVAATSNGALSGVIFDDANPEFDNYTYSYTIQHTHVVLKGKFLFDKGYWFTPWISASLGVGFNNAHSFNNKPIIFEAVKSPNFSSHTTSSLTYTIGAGLQKALNQHWQVGVGYEFLDWGKSQLGRAEQQTINGGLYLNHLYTNAVLLNLTYVT